LALAERAQLAVELALKDLLTPGLKTASAGLGTLDKQVTNSTTGLGRFQTKFAAVSKVAGVGLKGLAGIATVGFGAATKGALELEDVTARFQASTGATAEAAKKAGAAINAMSGRNIQPIGEIGDAMSKVYTDLGLTGDAATKTTEQFLKFGRATGQNATSAVAAFDDILDSFGITADHSGEIMDKLVASHQKYGGSIEENEAALSKMAPQLKALNLGLDDGVGLLNLFAASGLDASAGQKALNAAITKLPKGESIDQFLKRLAAVKDDGQRAQLAMSVFGTKAGAGLANAIKPGTDSLAAFEISASDAAGATQKAADAMDSTFGARAQLLLKQFGSAVTGVGQQFGPLLTGLASAGTLLGGLGFDKLAGKVADGLKGVASSSAVTSASSKIGDRIGIAIASATALGEKLSGAVSDGLSRLAASGPIKAITSRAGTFMGAAFGLAFAAGAKITEAVTGLMGSIPGLPGVGAATDKAGGLLGGRLGLAIKLGLVAGVAGLADAMLPEVEKAGVSLHDALHLPDIDINPANLPWPLGNKGAPDWAQIKHDTSQGSADVGNAIVTGINGVTGTVQSVMGQYEAAVAKAGTASEQTATVITHAFGPVGPEVQARMKMALAGVANFSNKSGGIIKEWRTEFAAGLKGGIGAVRQAREGIDGQFDQLMEDLKSFASRGKRIGHDIGQLTSKALQKALHSGNPLIRAEAREVQLNYLTELSTLVRKGHGIGVKGMEALHDGLKSKEGRVRAAARQILDTIDGQIDKPAVGRNAGSHIGGSLASSLRGKSGTVAGAARHIADVIRANLPRTISTTINVRVRTSDSTIGGRAGGGIIAPGQIVLVGEQGPEIGIGLAGGGARIISNQQSLPLLSAMAGLTGALSQRPTPTSPSSIRLPQRSEPKAKYPEFISVNVRAEVTSNSVNKAQYTSKRFGANPDMRI
jgi:hypothetical protein